MLHPAEARLRPAQAAREARRELTRLARPAGRFDASRFFRDAGGLGFLNVGAAAVRALARRLVHEAAWSLDDAAAVAERLMADRHLEAKGLAVEVMARYRRQFTPSLLPRWKAWLARNHAANWATTDAICGQLIGPLLLAHPRLAPRVAGWSRSRNLWLRRASIVGLIPLARRGQALTLVYRTAGRLHADRADLVQKAVGWALREAGKTDAGRLEAYLRANGRKIPRTTLRYAVERFAPAARRRLLRATRVDRPPGSRIAV